MPQLKTKKKTPLWKGPEHDGITQSMLSDYIVCKERFRIQVIEGWKKADEFNHRIEYGNMIHLCEETFLNEKAECGWRVTLMMYCEELCKKYKTQQNEIEKWYQVACVQFPLYIDYWKKHKKQQNQKSILQEEKFKVLYELPSGRQVNLRGKWDSVELVGKGMSAGLYLQENKVKGEINERQIERQVNFDLQTMTYLVALREWRMDKDVTLSFASEEEARVFRRELRDKNEHTYKIKGIIYNIIRRPLSGGKGTIKPHQERRNKAGKVTKLAETMGAFYNRLEKEVIMKDMDYFFMRWKIEITQQDIEKFERETLIPLLENLLDDYEWWVDCFRKTISLDPFDFKERERHFPHHQNRHFRTPFGSYSTLMEGRQGELDEFLNTGSTVGLERTKNLFPELE